MSNSQESSAGGIAQEINESGLDPAALASIGSVALALYYYYVRGEEQRGQFVGLWPVTIIGMATYLKLEQVRRKLEENDN
ncbi:hypothetical protein HUB97_13765 [Halorubraceae archaeon YAN]|nr:hypothetical protein [Halorubraceae archaeon YAN]